MPETRLEALLREAGADARLGPAVQARLPAGALSDAQLRAALRALGGSEPAFAALGRLLDPEGKRVRDRLFLLRHAQVCVRDPCGETRFCARAKAIWAHVSACSDPLCRTAYCASSKAALRHQQGCLDPECGMCRGV